MYIPPKLQSQIEVALRSLREVVDAEEELSYYQREKLETILDKMQEAFLTVG